MISTLLHKLSAKAVIGAALLAPLALAPAPASAQLVIRVGFAPPILPVYAQPVCPGEGYLWTPGYWAYGPEGYYWVPGTWVIAPTPGFLWTPAYWGWEGGGYLFHTGYWGPHIGFYGGINYGFGYGGHGYEGGYWNGPHFFYNNAVNNVNVNVVHNTYVRNVTVVNNVNRISFNGGQGGIQERPQAQEQAAMRENHIQPTAVQQQHFQAAQQDKGQYFNNNHGQPVATAARTPQEYHNQVNARQATQQGRIQQGVNSGQLTPGETRNLNNRDNSIHNQVQTDRQANAGQLTPQERQQVNQRQNNVSNSIYNDKHNGNTDAAAAARNDRTPQGEQRQAQRIDNRTAPPIPQPRPQAQPQPRPQPQPQAQPQPRPQPQARPEPQRQEAPRQEPQRQEAPRQEGPRGGGGERPRGR